MEKPLTGLIPEWRWLELRVRAISQAIDRYETAALEVPDQWRDEGKRHLLTLRTMYPRCYRAMLDETVYVESA